MYDSFVICQNIFYDLNIDMRAFHTYFCWLFLVFMIVCSTIVLLFYLVLLLFKDIKNPEEATILSRCPTFGVQFSQALFRCFTLHSCVPQCPLTGWTRRSCLPPSNSVSMNTLTICFAVSIPITLAPKVMMFALL